MARRRDLRPINETRRPDGTLTSETAYRLLKRRGGLARAAALTKRATPARGCQSRKANRGKRRKPLAESQD